MAVKIRPLKRACVGPSLWHSLFCRGRARARARFTIVNKLFFPRVKVTACRLKRESPLGIPFLISMKYIKTKERHTLYITLLAMDIVEKVVID